MTFIRNTLYYFALQYLFYVTKNNRLQNDIQQNDTLVGIQRNGTMVSIQHNNRLQNDINQNDTVLFCCMPIAE